MLQVWGGLDGGAMSMAIASISELRTEYKVPEAEWFVENGKAVLRGATAGWGWEIAYPLEAKALPHTAGDVPRIATATAYCASIGVPTPWRAAETLDQAQRSTQLCERPILKWAAKYLRGER